MAPKTCPNQIILFHFNKKINVFLILIEIRHIIYLFFTFLHVPVYSFIDLPWSQDFVAWVETSLALHSPHWVDHGCEHSISVPTLLPRIQGHLQFAPCVICNDTGWPLMETNNYSIREVYLTYNYGWAHLVPM